MSGNTLNIVEYLPIRCEWRLKNATNEILHSSMVHIKVVDTASSSSYNEVISDFNFSPDWLVYSGDNYTAECIGLCVCVRACVCVLSSVIVYYIQCNSILYTV